MALPMVIWYSWALMFIIWGFLGIIVYAAFAYFTSDLLLIKENINGREFIKQAWVKEKNDKDTGAIWWKSIFPFKKIKVPLPPTEIIDIGKFGRRIASCEIIDRTGEILQVVWKRDLGLKNESYCALCKVLQSQHGEIPHKFLAVTDSWKNFSVIERGVLVHQFQVAAKKRTGDSLLRPELIIPMGALFIMMIIIIIGIVEWDSLVAPGQAAQQTELQQLKVIERIAEKLNVPVGAQTIEEQQAEQLPGGENEKPPILDQIR